MVAGQRDVANATAMKILVPTVKEASEKGLKSAALYYVLSALPSTLPRAAWALSWQVPTVSLIQLVSMLASR